MRASILRPRLGGCGVRLEPAVLAELDAIWPGPGREAPAEYAW
ncbi:hypothetical protein ACPW96_03665 [Micromonospora sp. DT81.3]